MHILFLSFLAGVLTILAPCVLPVLPVIIGGSLTERDYLRPFIVTGSLSFSIVLFTLVLKTSAVLISIPNDVWKIISGGIILIFGIVTLFPRLWEKIEAGLKLSSRSHGWLSSSHKHSGRWGGVLTGMALGPVFSSCSPTYALILATILPQSFFAGVANLMAYSLGLAVVFLLIAISGQKIISKMRWAADPDGWFKKGLGILFIFVGIAILFGFDNQAETFLIEKKLFLSP